MNQCYVHEIEPEPTPEPEDPTDPTEPTDESTDGE